MIIKSVLLDKKRYKLVDESYCNKSNAFTIIVGSNGAGKSRLLKRIVNNIKNVNYEESRIPNNYSRQLDFDLNGYESSFYSSSAESKSFISINKKEIDGISGFSKVIAVTTTPFDKFPVEYKGNEVYRYHEDDRYTYIGLKVSKNALNQSNFINLLARSMLSSDRVFQSKKLFSLLNLSPGALVQMKAKLPTKNTDLMEFNYKTHDFDYHDFDKKFFVKSLKRNHPSIYQKVERECIINDLFNAYKKCYEFLSEPIDPESYNFPKKDLIYLLDVGLIINPAVVYI
ncbi:MAG: hypothetical protein AB7S90_14415 [Marinobacterium sp.]